MGAAFPAAAAAGLGLRRVEESDRDFLLDLYVAVRAAEFAPLGWPEPALRQFLAQQQDFQDRQYRAACGNAEWLIVERDGGAVGRFYLDESEDDILLLDISLLPEARGRGFGAALLADLAARAAAAGKPIRLHVERSNPARRLYERAGFTLWAEGGVHDELRLQPDPSVSGKLLKSFVQIAD